MHSYVRHMICFTQNEVHARVAAEVLGLPYAVHDASDVKTLLKMISAEFLAADTGMDLIQAESYIPY